MCIGPTSEHLQKNQFLVHSLPPSLPPLLLQRLKKTLPFLDACGLTLRTLNLNLEVEAEPAPTSCNTRSAFSRAPFRSRSTSHRSLLETPRLVLRRVMLGPDSDALIVALVHAHLSTRSFSLVQYHKRMRRAPSGSWEVVHVGQHWRRKPVRSREIVALLRVCKCELLASLAD